MLDILKNLPVESPERIIEDVYDRNNKTEIVELEAVLNKNMSIDKFVDSLDKEDELTKTIYSKTKNNKIIFPKERDSRSEYIGEIGEQNDIFHKESLSQSIKSALVSLDEDELKNKELNRDGMQLITIFSKEGMKYTAHTKDIAENSPRLAFDRPDQLSAYMAARRFKEMGLERQDALIATAVIYNQENYKNKWNEKIKETGFFSREKEKTFGEDFKSKYGEKAEKMLESLDRANVGYKNKVEIEKNAHVFEKGEKMLKKDVPEKITGALNKWEPSRENTFAKFMKEKKKSVPKLEKEEKTINKSVDNNDLSRREAIIKEKRRRDLEIKRQRDNIAYKKMDDRINKGFIKSVEGAVDINFLANGGANFEKKMIIEGKKNRIKDQEKDKGMER